jgi:hypothetical protein
MTVQELLGHTSPVTTAVYTKVNNESMRQACKLIGRCLLNLHGQRRGRPRQQAHLRVQPIHTRLLGQQLAAHLSWALQVRRSINGISRSSCNRR